MAANPAPVTIPADELEKAGELVDKYAGKYPAVEIIAVIRKQLNFVGCVSNYNKIATRIAAHPHYQAKLHDIDLTDLTNRIAAGHTTVFLAAKELDVPQFALAQLVRHAISKQHTSKCTEEETRRLVDYVQGCSSKPDLNYISKLLGTKSR
ncbi:hypothetical protein GGI21_004300, partial [Coemansia aciculifera]